MYDVIIIGAGPAGYTAAMYAARFELKTLIIANVDGGTLTQTHLIENWPGVKSATGYDLSMSIADHAKSMGTETVSAIATKVCKDGDLYKIETDDKKEFNSKTVVICTGTEHRKLGLESEKKLTNKGVSYCATCDGAFFKDEVVCIIGGSDSAIKESLLLSEYAKKVYVIYRGENIRPEPINRKRMQNKDNIELITKANVVEILGEKEVDGVVLDTGQKIDLKAVFIAIGGTPQSSLVKDLSVNLNEKNEIIINKYAQTNVGGLFAAGDVTDSHFKQAIVSASEGSNAANSAFEYIKSKNFK